MAIRNKSKVTISGKHKDVPLWMAWKYYMQYVNGKRANAVYQRYPKKDYKPMDLMGKIEMMKQEED